MLCVLKSATSKKWIIYKSISIPIFVEFFANLNKSIDLKMAYEQYNVPLAGDILDDLAMAFREILSKVGLSNENEEKKNRTISILSFIEHFHFSLETVDLFWWLSNFKWSS